MSAGKRSSEDPYREIRKLFKRLDLPQKGAFVIEAFFSTLAEALEEAGEALARAVNEEFSSPSSSSRKQPSNGKKQGT